ncbi:LLM class F420-dependent oxidoreductase [Sesbania bispinosa]|nr:LLM class F420-dependent oxidoreductase [Sesbania bispinosa]
MQKSRRNGRESLRERERRQQEPATASPPWLREGAAHRGSKNESQQCEAADLAHHNVTVGGGSQFASKARHTGKGRSGRGWARLIWLRLGKADLVT